MSLINFGGSNSQQGVFTRIKPYPTPNVQSIVSDGGIPVVRSGNKNYFIFNRTTTNGDAAYRTVLSLYTTNPDALVVAFDFTSIVASAKILAAWLSSSDQAMFIVYKGVDGLIRLSSMNDNTGAMTHIGSGFTPTTPANWSFGKLELIGGDLKYTYNGKYHTLNKTTGAVISQDNVFGLAGYATTGADYVSLDGAIYSTGDLRATTLNTNSVLNGAILIPKVASTVCGVIESKYTTIVDVFGAVNYGYSSTPFPFDVVLVDNDKMAFTSFISQHGIPLNMVLRASYDEFLSSVVNWWGGLR